MLESGQTRPKSQSLHLLMIHKTSPSYHLMAYGLWVIKRGCCSQKKKKKRYGGLLVYMIGVLIQRGNLETETHACRENAVKVKAERGDASTCQRTPVIARKTPDTKREAQNTLPHTFRRNQACRHPDLGLQPPEHFRCSSPPGVVFVKAALANEYDAHCTDTG